MGDLPRMPSALAAIIVTTVHEFWLSRSELLAELAYAVLFIHHLLRTSSTQTTRVFLVDSPCVAVHVSSSHQAYKVRTGVRRDTSSIFAYHQRCLIFLSSLLWVAGLSVATWNLRTSYRGLRLAKALKTSHGLAIWGSHVGGEELVLLLLVRVMNGSGSDKLVRLLVQVLSA
jgi:hypothetical protein